MTTVYVACTDQTPLAGGQKYRISFEQGTIENWLAGGTLSSIYQALGDPANFPWGFPISEPPQDDAQVFVVDLQIRNGTVGAAPPGTVADLVNSLGDLTFYNAYTVARIEQLPTDAPILEQKSVVQSQALTDAKQSGVLGALDTVGTGIGGAISGLKASVGTVLVVIAVVALAIATIQLRKATT
jgi:hypothetical protein